MNLTKGNRERFLSWENLQERMDLSIPFIQTVSGEHLAHFFYEPARQELGVRLHIDSPELPNVQPVSVRITVQEIDRKTFLEIRSSDELLLREFYDFCCEVIDEVQINGTSPAQAVDAEWGAWVRLLDREAILSREKQIGLIGELWFLQVLIDTYGFESALDAWHRDNSAEHDFCCTEFDVEVKSTTSEQRIHLINSFHQLAATNDRELFLLSVQLTPSAKSATGSMSLSSLVSSLTQAAPSIEQAEALKRRLEFAGWKEEHSRHYRQTYLLRTTPAMIPVDENCPRIVYEDLLRIKNMQIERIKSISYRIDVTGLGTEDLGGQLLKSSTKGKA